MSVSLRLRIRKKTDPCNGIAAEEFLILRFENYYEGSLKVKEGRFLTTKKEKEFHGYGIKSIRYTVNKYDGAVSIDTKENWFDLKILIPMKKLHLTECRTDNGVQ